jgi:hypothetical protein
MKAIAPVVVLTCLCALTLISCESAEEKQARIDKEERFRVEAEQGRLRLAEEKRIAEEEERRKQAIWAEFSENSLGTGEKPWSRCFGRKNSCSGGCSEIKINGSLHSDVLVILKRNNVVKRHAYIAAGNSYAFEIPNGTWQPFFYYGEGWYPKKEMESSSCESLMGGFLEGEQWDKDLADDLNDVIITYTLTSVRDGNFQTKDSNQKEAL